MQILFVSLGCDKNLVDTEMMLGQLAEKGYTFTDDEAEADIAVVNSCCFIGDAKEESINTILQLAEWKTEGRLKALIVCGCLAQRYKDEIQTEIPEVDAIIGTTARNCRIRSGRKKRESSRGYRPRLRLRGSEKCHDRRTFCVSENRRGLQ